MKTKKERINALIARARALGSKAKTLRGVGRVVIAHSAAHPIGVRRARANSSERGARQRDEYCRARHNKRLIARYSCKLNGLPRFLSPADRRVITESPVDRLFRQSLDRPLITRSFYDLSSLREISRLQSKLKKWDAAKGRLIDHPEIAYLAYSQADWGRLKKTYTGKSTPWAGIRTKTNGMRGWYTVYWHHADYTLIVPKNFACGVGLYVSPGHKSSKTFCSPHYLKIGDKTFRRHRAAPTRKPLPVHIQRRILALAVPSILSIEYDRTTKSLAIRDSRDDVYHLPEIKTIGDARLQARKSITAFRKRREEKIAAAELARKCARTFVSYEDSIRAGNCESQTASFADAMFRSLGAAGPCAVRADVVLAARDDSYTRRAVAAAMSRA